MSGYSWSSAAGGGGFGEPPSLADLASADFVFRYDKLSGQARRGLDECLLRSSLALTVICRRGCCYSASRYARIVS